MVFFFFLWLLWTPSFFFPPFFPLPFLMVARLMTGLHVCVRFNAAATAASAASSPPPPFFLFCPALPFPPFLLAAAALAIFCMMVSNFPFFLANLIELILSLSDGDRVSFASAAAAADDDGTSKGEDGENSASVGGGRRGSSGSESGW